MSTLLWEYAQITLFRSSLNNLYEVPIRSLVDQRVTIENSQSTFAVEMKIYSEILKSFI